MAVTLIRPSEVVNFGIGRATPANVRFDQQKVSANITVAELRWLVVLLGQDLYDDMIAEAYAGDSNPPTLPKFPNSVPYETLWNLYLWEFTARAVMLESFPTIGVHIGVNGLFLANTETSDNAGIGGLKYLSDNFTSQLETLKAAIEKYLCANIADFPLYPADRCECECTPENKATRKFGIVITDKMRHNHSHYKY